MLPAARRQHMWYEATVACRGLWRNVYSGGNRVKGTEVNSLMHQNLSELSAGLSACSASRHHLRSTVSMVTLDLPGIAFAAAIREAAVGAAPL